ncbi:hypothetical protein PR048_024160 [Dryococelus australis]|uniref:Uncharacterized protein n=1 Tax=Dryococelus australis TaxID=614101 RepID=A0ABQ9GW42_9NEOP|nr:hypothetical protein PR048_024160 [Dryococelus australis]
MWNTAPNRRKDGTGYLVHYYDRLACSPPGKADRVQSLTGSLPDSRMWESCRTMPLVGGFSRGYPVSPTLSFLSCSILTPNTLIGSQDLAVKSRKRRTDTVDSCSLRWFTPQRLQIVTRGIAASTAYGSATREDHYVDLSSVTPYKLVVTLSYCVNTPRSASTYVFWVQGRSPSGIWSRDKTRIGDQTYEYGILDGHERSMAGTGRCKYGRHDYDREENNKLPGATFRELQPVPILRHSECDRFESHLYYIHDIYKRFVRMRRRNILEIRTSAVTVNGLYPLRDTTRAAGTEWRLCRAWAYSMCAPRAVRVQVDKRPVAPSWFETRSEIGSNIDTENCCTIRVQSWAGDRDEVHFEPLEDRNFDPRSAATDTLNTFSSSICVKATYYSQSSLSKLFDVCNYIFAAIFFTLLVLIFLLYLGEQEQEQLLFEAQLATATAKRTSYEKGASGKAGFTRCKMHFAKDFVRNFSHESHMASTQGPIGPQFASPCTQTCARSASRASLALVLHRVKPALHERQLEEIAEKHTTGTHPQCRVYVVALWRWLSESCLRRGRLGPGNCDTRPQGQARDRRRLPERSDLWAAVFTTTKAAAARPLGNCVSPSSSSGGNTGLQVVKFVCSSQTVLPEARHLISVLRQPPTTPLSGQSAAASH